MPRKTFQPPRGFVRRRVQPAGRCPVTFGLDLPLALGKKWPVRTCVIFNPTAKGDKARRFRQHLDELARSSLLKLTRGPGDARPLAAEAVREGFEVVVAAGGDGTVNEVVNGIADCPDGLLRARLGVLPLGTVNVFARELGIPQQFGPAWEVIRRGRKTSIDLPRVEFGKDAGATCRRFVQMAGAGLDARAIELVRWPVKKWMGPLAYVLAGLQALAEAPARITAAAHGRSVTGGLVLLGNGRFYGGSYRVFPNADLRDGRLEVCVFPRINWFTLLRCGPVLLGARRLPESVVTRFQSDSLALSSPAPAPFEVDGDLAGHLPARFGFEPLPLQVLVP